MVAYPQQINGVNSPPVVFRDGGSYQALAYAIKREYTPNGPLQQEFVDFYQSAVMDWLKANNTGYAYAWLVGNYLVVIGSPTAATLPWVGYGGIAGLTKYLEAHQPMAIQNLPSFVG